MLLLSRYSFCPNGFLLPFREEDTGVGLTLTWFNSSLFTVFVFSQGSKVNQLTRMKCSAAIRGAEGGGKGLDGSRDGEGVYRAFSSQHQSDIQSA